MTASAPLSRLNDVDLTSVSALVQGVPCTPASTSTTWQAQVSWSGGFRSEARIRDFAPTRSDEPHALGGDDTAPNPVEQLLAALGNCLAVGYAANATAEGIEIRDLRIDLTGDLDLGAFLGLRPGHAGFDSIRATVHLDADATPEQLDELHAAVADTSPVGHTLSAPIPLTIAASRTGGSPDVGC